MFKGTNHRRITCIETDSTTQSPVELHFKLLTNNDVNMWFYIKDNIPYKGCFITFGK